MKNKIFFGLLAVSFSTLHSMNAIRRLSPCVRRLCTHSTTDSKIALLLAEFEQLKTKQLHIETQQQITSLELKLTAIKSYASQLRLHRLIEAAIGSGGGALAVGSILSNMPTYSHNPWIIFSGAFGTGVLIKLPIWYTYRRDLNRLTTAEQNLKKQLKELSKE